MTGFREHFMDKYFAYRRRYVDFVIAEAPERARMGVVSEIARLSFMVAGNALCALIFWLLTAGAAAREGALAVWTVLFASLALLPTVFAILASLGIVAALRDRRRVAERASAQREASPR